MSLFNSLGGGNQQQGQQNQVTPQQAWNQFQNDPVGSLRQVGLNIPSGMNNPQQIYQHLIQSGQLPQSRISQLMQMLGQMGRR